MQKRQVNINAVKAAIDEYFSEVILKSEVKDNDSLLPSLLSIKGVEYVHRKIDTTKEDEMRRIAEYKLNRFLQEHPDNSLKLFIDLQIEKATEWQSHFPEYKRNPEQKTYFYLLKRWKEFLQEDFHIIPLIKGGKQVKSYSDFFDETGIAKRLKDKHGIILNPTENFEKLKLVRTDLYELKKNEFIEERNIDGVETSEFEILCFRRAWLQNELSVIKQWMNPNYEGKNYLLSTSKQIELAKYKHYVELEIEKVDRIFNTNPFDDLFEKALLFEVIEKPKNEGHKEAIKAYYQTTFNLWLNEKKGWITGDPIKYNQLVTKENFQEFLKEEEEERQLKLKSYEEEKESWQKPIKNRVKKNSENFSLRQIAIAYSVLDIQINSKNARSILAKHSNLTSIDKLLSKRILRPSELTKISDNRTKDSKHLKDLLAAKRLVSGMKITQGLKSIDRIIIAFQNNFNNKY